MLRDFDPCKWNGHTVILYGFGKDGQYIRKALDNRHVQDILLCDQNKDLVRESGGILPEQLGNFPGAAILIGSSRYAIEIYETIKRYKTDDAQIFTTTTLYRAGLLENPHDASQWMTAVAYSDRMVELNAYIEGDWAIPYLDLSITSKCTLQCKGCSSCIPFYKHPEHEDPAVMYDALDNLLAARCHVGTLCLIGGEPFLNQELFQDVLERYHASSQIHGFITFSNGTVLIKPETIRAMKRCERFSVVFSNYGKKSTRLAENLRILDRETISYALVDMENPGEFAWMDYGDFSKNSLTDDENQAMMEHCDSRYCTTLLGGRLARCEYIARGYDLTKLPVFEKSTVDLTSQATVCMRADEIRRRCLEVCYGSRFPPGCTYCHIGEKVHLERAAQI